MRGSALFFMNASETYMGPNPQGGGPMGSLWDGLSPYLVASFYEVEKKQGSDGAYRWQPVENGPLVRAPLADSNLDVVLNWQSPFEQSGPETKAPTLLAMLQSGTLLPLVDTVMSAAGLGAGTPSGQDKSSAQAKTKGFLEQFEGRTGITKLNSTQVFTGMAPIKIQLTALFRAWRDTGSEVMAPFNQLMAWALPEQLNSDGSMLDRLAKLKNTSNRTAETYVDALLPSYTPKRIALWYKGRTFSPLVIETISEPMNSPVDSNGKYVELAVQMTLGTLTAWDKTDWAATAGGAAP
jgi:hypothetical protein